MAVLYFNPSVSNLPAVGETFAVDVKVRDISDLLFFMFDVSYDAENLRFVSLSLIQNIENLHEPAAQSLRRIPYIRFNISNDLSPPVSGDLTLGTITFEVINRVASEFHFRSGFGSLEDSAFDEIDFTTETGQLSTSLKPLRYRGYPVALTVKIHDQDVTAAIASVDNIGQGIDYPNLTEFRVGEASCTLRDIHGDFSPNNPSNFFTQHSGQRTGRNSPIEIEAGFIVNGTRYTETVFKGTILRLVQDAAGATVKVVCTDNFGDIRKSALADFGVSRHFRLLEDLAQTQENGFYPVLSAVMAASDGSVKLATRTGEEIAPVQRLKTEGTLSPRNFIIDDKGVHTEGGVIVNRQVNYPQLRMKSPYRYRHLLDVITDILNHAGITNSDIAIPEQDVDAHFSSNGRINYDLIGNIGSGNPVTWNGYVTDFLYDADNDKWYFLYNKHRNNPNGFSQVIEYDVATRTYNKLHGFSSATEVWKFTKSGNNLYLLTTTGGNYDANENSCETQIIQLDITSKTETVFVAHTVSLQPQIAHYYHGVGSVFMKPDSRRPLIYRQNDGLYYAFVDSTNSTFGIAKATAPGARPTSIITMNADDYENHGGIGFDINGRTLLGGMTFLSGGRSQVLGFKKSL